VDDSLIPSDPDEAPSAVESYSPDMSPAAIPWVAAGEEDTSGAGPEVDDNVSSTTTPCSICYLC
jgi:hypothetical protein